MKLSLKILVLVFLLQNFGVAQDLNRFRNTVLSLEQRINYLQQVAERYRLQKVIDYLQTARTELEKAKDIVRENPLHLKEAWLSYTRAKQITDAAAKLLVIKPALKMSAEMDRLINKAEIEVQKSNNSESRYMLNKARTFRVKAQNAYRNSVLLKAQEYHRISIYYA